MAFDKFKRVDKVDDRLLDLMYNLALDFERNASSTSPARIYEYMPGTIQFKDVQTTVRAPEMESTITRRRQRAAPAPHRPHHGGDKRGKAECSAATRGARLGKGAMAWSISARTPIRPHGATNHGPVQSSSRRAKEVKGVASPRAETPAACRIRHLPITMPGRARPGAISHEHQGLHLVRHTKPNALWSAGVLRSSPMPRRAGPCHGNGGCIRDIKPPTELLPEPA